MSQEEKKIDFDDQDWGYTPPTYEPISNDRVEFESKLPTDLNRMIDDLWGDIDPWQGLHAYEEIQEGAREEKIRIFRRMLSHPGRPQRRLARKMLRLYGENFN